MAKYKAALFDVDGTILNTMNYSIKAMQHCVRVHCGKEVTDQEVLAVMGKPIELCYQLLTGLDAVAHLYDGHRTFQLENLHLAIPFPNTFATFATLKKNGLKIGIVTTRGKITLEKVLEKAELHQFIDTIIAKEDVLNHKPHPEPVQRALTALSIAPEDAVMVGDTEYDIFAGKGAGTATIGVTYGTHGEKIRDTHPDYVVSDIEEVTNIILGE